MTVLVSGTNRAGNLTRPVVDALAAQLATLGEETEVIDLVDMGADVVHSGMYDKANTHAFVRAADRTLSAAARWIFVLPEYNGSYPGALKIFVDALSVRDYETMFAGKAVGLVGTSSGRAGNLRGLDHFGSVLGYLNAIVMPYVLPISLIDGLVADGKLDSADTENALGQFASRYLAFAERVGPVPVDA